MWKKARDQQEQIARCATFRSALEELYQYLYPELKHYVMSWLLNRVDKSTIDEPSQQFVMSEVVDAYVMNVFNAITPALSTLEIEEQEDVHAELLALVEQSLYNIF